MRKPGIDGVNVILFSINALIWALHLVVDLTHGITEAPLLVLHGLCTAIWGFGAVVWFRRWRAHRGEKNAKDV